jgi:Transposase, Mutator family
VGYAGEPRHGVQPQQEDLRPDRSLAEPADRGEQPYLYLDGIVLKRTWAGEVRNVSLLVAISVNADGYRQILGIVEGAKEDKAGWSAFLAHLKGRGLHGVELIVSDACMGLVESAAEYFPEARWQRCMPLLPQRLQPCAGRQAARGGGDAEGHPCPGRPSRRPTQSWRGRRSAPQREARQGGRAGRDGSA